MIVNAPQFSQRHCRWQCCHTTKLANNYSFRGRQLFEIAILFYVVAAKLSFSSHFARAKFLLTRHRNASCEHAKVSVSRLSTLDPHCRGCLKLFSLAPGCEQTNHTHPILRSAWLQSTPMKSLEGGSGRRSPGPVYSMLSRRPSAAVA